MLPLQFPDRLAAFVLELAQTAGFPGTRTGNLDGIDLTSGEYRFHDDAFLAAIDFLLSFARDDTMFLASTALDARSARVRWAAEGAAFFPDGPYNVGVLAGKFPEVLGRLGVGPIPTPDGRPPVLTRPPTAGTFWVSSRSGAPDVASALLELFVSGEYQRGLAAAMDQPPLDLGVVAASDAHPTYKRCIQMFAEQVFVGPAATARNPLTAQVHAAMTPVEPGLGRSSRDRERAGHRRARPVAPAVGRVDGRPRRRHRRGRWRQPGRLGLPGLAARRGLRRMTSIVQKARPGVAGQLWQARWPYLFLLPTVVLYGLYTVYPIVASYWYSLVEWNGFEGDKTFVGLRELPGGARRSAVLELVQDHRAVHAGGRAGARSLLTPAAGDRAELAEAAVRHAVPHRVSSCRW